MQWTKLQVPNVENYAKIQSLYLEQEMSVVENILPINKA